MGEPSKQVWFRTDGDKWHGAQSRPVMVLIDAPNTQVTGPFVGLCGFGANMAEAIVTTDGILPVGEGQDEPVCLHCQRALEMARRGDD